MIKKSVTYEDFNGETVTEEHHFHMSKAELVELEVSKKQGFQQYLEDIVASRDNFAIVNMFRDIVLMSYGQKSPDGRRFIKSDELRENFKQTEAFSTLFMDLATDEDNAADFINGIVPNDIGEKKVKVQERGTLKSVPAEPEQTNKDEDVDVDVDKLLSEMPEEEPKKTISKKQAAYLKDRLSEDQFKSFMKSRVIED